MASADLRDELSCSICLEVYRDPVTLSCGHNFCRDCISSVLDRQESSGLYTCPDCREDFLECPALRRNTTLRNIAQHFSPPEQEASGVFCTFCDYPVPAVQSCVQCETSMCRHHLMKHDRSVEHTLIPPGSKKCDIHHKVLDYYCCEDFTCICAWCVSSGHSGHQVEILDKTLQTRKENMRNLLQKLTTNMEETKTRVQSLHKREQYIQEKANGFTERVRAVFGNLRRQLEVLEKRVLSEISRQKEQASLSIQDTIQQLEAKMKDVSEKVSHLKELCGTSDPITLLRKSHGDNFWDTQVGVCGEKAGGDKCCDVGDLDEGLIAEMLEEALSKITTGVKTGLQGPGQTSLLMDINTAGNHVLLSADSRTATWTKENLTYPEPTPERFQYPQILSIDGFHTGQHYWEVETSDTGGWRVGMCYPSMDRTGDQSYIGDNEKSWCLRWQKNQYSVLHDNVETMLSREPSCHRLRICLNYEAGQLSFYEACDPLRHLHTFTATFTEPLHLGFRLHRSWVKILNPD